MLTEAQADKIKYREIVKIWDDGDLMIAEAKLDHSEDGYGNTIRLFHVHSIILTNNAETYHQVGKEFYMSINNIEQRYFMEYPEFVDRHPEWLC